MIEAEWSALVCERKAAESQGKVATDAFRLAAEVRRQLMLLDRELASTMRYKPAPASSSPPSLAEHLRRRGAGAE
jgi:hypothetical protein